MEVLVCCVSTITLRTLLIQLHALTRGTTFRSIGCACRNWNTVFGILEESITTKREGEGSCRHVFLRRCPTPEPEGVMVCDCRRIHNHSYLLELGIRWVYTQCWSCCATTIETEIWLMRRTGLMILAVSLITNT